MTCCSGGRPRTPNKRQTGARTLDRRRRNKGWLNVKCSLHCSPPRIESVVVAARNGGLPKRYASCPASGKDLERWRIQFFGLLLSRVYKRQRRAASFVSAATATLKQAPAPVAIVVQATFPPAPAVGEFDSSKHFTAFVQQHRPIG